MAVALAALVCLTSCGHHVKTDPTPSKTEWDLDRDAPDSDLVCDPPTQDDGGWRFCRTLGEIRAFVRSRKG